MVTMMDKSETDTAFTKARNRNGTQGQYRAEQRAKRKTTADLIYLMPRHKRAEKRRILLGGAKVS